MERKVYSTAAGYIADQSDTVRKKLLALRAIIFELIPDTTELINYGIPAYTMLPDGKREQQIMIAGYKSHVGLYPHPTTIEHFLVELTPYKFSKGAVQFPLNQPLPKDLIISMINYRLKLLKK